MSKRPLIMGVLLLTCIISGVLYMKLAQIRKAGEDKYAGSLEFASIQNGAFMDYEQRLKKSDLFISDFVPTEYTQYVAPAPIYKNYFPKQVQKRALLVEPEDANKIMADAMKTSSTTMTTTTTTTSTTTTARGNDQERVILQEYLDEIERDTSVDPALVKMLNETISAPETREEVLGIIKGLVEKLSMQTSTTEKPAEQLFESSNLIEVLDDDCLEISAYKILPNDDAQTAQKKHGNFNSKTVKNAGSTYMI